MTTLNIYLTSTDNDIITLKNSLPHSQTSSTFRRLIRAGIIVEKRLGVDWETRLELLLAGGDIIERLQRIESKLINGVVIQQDEIEKIVDVGFEL